MVQQAVLDGEQVYLKAVENAPRAEELALAGVLTGPREDIVDCRHSVRQGCVERGR